MGEWTTFNLAIATTRRGCHSLDDTGQVTNLHDMLSRPFKFALACGIPSINQIMASELIFKRVSKAICSRPSSLGSKNDMALFELMGEKAARRPSKS